MVEVSYLCIARTEVRLIKLTNVSPASGRWPGIFLLRIIVMIYSLYFVLSKIILIFAMRYTDFFRVI